MNGDITPDFQAKIEAAAKEKAIAAQANSTPLPGALRDAFSPQQDIVVGKYKVRPFYEIDFEILQMCDHPLAKMALGGEKYGEKLQDLRGQVAWTACWLLTHDVDEVDEISAKGVEAVQKAARREFGRLQLGGVIEISKAVIEQYVRYFSTVIGLEQSSDGEDAPKKA